MYILCTCIVYMYCVHVLCTCIVYMYMYIIISTRLNDCYGEGLIQILFLFVIKDAMIVCATVCTGLMLYLVCNVCMIDFQYLITHAVIIFQ